MANKIKFGLSNVHYAKITEVSEGGVPTYGAIKRIPGAVNLALDPEGTSEPFYADNIVFHNTKTNAGYAGDLEIALIPDDFRIDILGDKVDDNGVIIEDSDAQGSEFAFFFQFEGDESGRRHIMWRCSVERPSVEGATKEDTTTPNTDTLTLTAMAREDNHQIKGYVDNTAEQKSVYENWFTQVYEPTFENSQSLV